ncbi:MAG: FAD-dependent oxidoreductase, partial [Thermodesulfobacteriota bacterium]|nr:FAD-dependent oxidoreductase [Thermodesulfobacteriota bacterium]
MESLEGDPGHFQVVLRNDPRYINPDKCTGCGQCSNVCPVNGINEYDCGLDLRAATSIRYAQAIPLAYTIDRDMCIGCGICEKACLAEAIQYDDKPRKTELEIGAIVLALGNDVYDPGNLDTLAYKKSPNVITSLEFERILSASGPYMGHLMRPYDREEPQKIAWLQCVGSRDTQEGRNSYCSAVCCMYAIKEAVISMEHAHEELSTTIFYMDMRTHGKDFENYYDRARKEHGVRFVRSRVHSIDPLDGGDLRINYTDESGEQKSEIFNLVVLSVGFEVGQETRELAERFGIDLNKNSFVKTNSFTPMATNREGIYVCGAIQGPKDIPQAVVEASAAAAATSVLLSESRWSETRQKEIPPQTNVIGERPRVGVFICQCGINIAGVVNVQEVRDYALTLPYVTFVETNMYTCSQDTQVKMTEVIKEQDLNRVVVAACTPKTHEALFQETLMDSGLNKYLFEMANIRNQDSWVHPNDPEAATEKAKDLVRMAVSKAALLEPLPDSELGLNSTTLVVGGGIAGMVAAKNIAEQGFDVHLVERSENLGGQARSLNKTWKGEDIQAYVTSLVSEIEVHPKIQVHYSTEVAEVDGFVGNFKTRLKTKAGEETTLEHGIAIMATGGHEYRPSEYLYGQDPRVLTHLELDQRFVRDDPSLKEIRSAVFIQCVGSREPDRPYCSRVCCTHSVESALELKKRNPDMNVYVIYRDMRTYGEREDLFAQAREEGVIFFRYDPENKPKVNAGTDGL